MLGSLFKCQWGRIGLDIGASGGRMLQLTRVGSNLRVAAAARWHFPPGPPSDGDARRRHIREAVADALKTRDFRGRDVVSCLRACELNIKNIRLPHMLEHELASAIPWECSQRFGFQVAPDRLHFINAGEVRQGAEVRDEIILMAATEEAVNRHLETLSAARLRPIHIDAEPTALFRTYERFLRRVDDEGIVTVIVDVGYSAAKVVVARGRVIVLVKTVDLGGQKLDECVAKHLNLDLAEASSLRKRNLKPVGDAPPDAAGGHSQVQWSIQDAIREPVEALAREVSLCLRYCSVSFRGLRPTKITLAGGEAYDPMLLKLLGENLDCPCVLGEPLQGVDLGSANFDGDRRGQLAEWSVATGLALRDLVTTTQQEKVA